MLILNEKDGRFNIIFKFIKQISKTAYMIVPIKMKPEEFLVVVQIEVSHDYKSIPVEELVRPFPESFVPLYYKVTEPIVKVYCLCNNQNDFINLMGRTGFKATLL